MNLIIYIDLDGQISTRELSSVLGQLGLHPSGIFSLGYLIRVCEILQLISAFLLN